ncbi:alpha/beta hydrolase [Aliishimia ponticola]|nr:alpha/beta hydrolase [Aliishimia ponticola]
MSLPDALRLTLPETGPIIIMIHGFKYRPGHGSACPHGSIFATDTARGAAAWPRHLGFGLGHEDEGLGIAFGWNARGHLRQAYKRAATAGQELAALITQLRTRAPGRRIHILTHSMGSEVAFCALPHLPAQSVSRILCLTGASFRSTALAAMDSPAGRTAELVNITSRENDLFDWLFEWSVPAPQRGDRAMGHGLKSRNIGTLQLDHPEHITALARLGSHIAPPNRRVCHWSGYLRPGALRVWARAMRQPEQLPLHLIAPSPPAPRWSRIVALPGGSFPGGATAASQPVSHV